MSVVDMDILQSAEEAGGKIGNPTPYNTAGMIFIKGYMQVRYINEKLRRLLQVTYALYPIF